ncbi:hypothetical protein DFH11DRAFT_1546321 [Phellopilus nigrolimitatus]|nr:hypothetical protein DFH11DRAFT_1546321 [Phellopilus nigrolimitatus]
MTTLIRNSLRDISTFPGFPIEIYALAVRQGWTETVQYACQFTSYPRATTSHERAALESLDAPALLKLIEYHGCREIAIQESLVISYDKNTEAGLRKRRFHWEIICKRHVGACRSNAHNKTSWTAFKYHVISELSRPTRDGEIAARFGAQFWDGLEIWDDVCHKCSTVFFNRDGMIAEFSRIFASLPNIVD